MLKNVSGVPIPVKAQEPFFSPRGGMFEPIVTLGPGRRELKWVEGRGRAWFAELSLPAGGILPLRGTISPRQFRPAVSSGHTIRLAARYSNSDGDGGAWTGSVTSNSITVRVVGEGGKRSE